MLTVLGITIQYGDRIRCCNLGTYVEPTWNVERLGSCSNKSAGRNALAATIMSQGTVEA